MQFEDEPDNSAVRAALKERREKEKKRLRLMIGAVGMEAVIDREDKKVKEHPAWYYDREELLIPAIQENPWLLKLPIVRNGNKMTTGYQPDVWNQWE